MQITKETNNPHGRHIFRVLVVDDETDAVDLLELILTTQRDNCIVHKAYTANEALKILESNPVLPDLILMDVKMPGKDGFTLTKQLKNHSKYKQIPIILLSALTFPDDIKKGYESGASDYILKPWSNQDLVERIDYQLSMV